MIFVKNAWFDCNNKCNVFVLVWLWFTSYRNYDYHRLNKTAVDKEEGISKTSAKAVKCQVSPISKDFVDNQQGLGQFC